MSLQWNSPSTTNRGNTGRTSCSAGELPYRNDRRETLLSTPAPTLTETPRSSGSVTVRQVPSPYVESPSVVSDWGMPSLYPNPSPVVSSPYTNPPSNISSPYATSSSLVSSPYPNSSSYGMSPYPSSGVSTPFNIHDDDMTRNENTYIDNSANLTSLQVSHTPKRSLGSDEVPLPETSNGDGEPGSVSNKRFKKYEETVLDDVVDMFEEQVQRDNEVGSLTDADAAKADDENTERLLAKYLLLDMGKQLIKSGHNIGPHTPAHVVEKLKKFLGLLIPTWDNQCDGISLPPPFSPIGDAVLNEGTEDALQSQRSHNIAGTSSNGFPQPQYVQAPRDGTFLRQPQTAQPSPAPVPRVAVDPVVSQRSLSNTPSNRNGSTAPAMGMRSRHLSLPRPQVSYAPNNSQQAMQNFRTQSPLATTAPQFRSRMPSTSSSLSTQSGSSDTSDIRVRVGNTVYIISNFDWAAVCQCTSQTRMLKKLFDKLFDHDERLLHTVSGRRSRSELPGLNPCKMTVFYACVAFLRDNPNQFPEEILASQYVLNDREKAKINKVLSEKLNAFRRRQAQN